MPSLLASAASGDLLEILDAETRGFISLCLEHDHGVRPSADQLLADGYLATPLGGPGSDDDKPVEVQPRDGARADPSAPATAVAAVPGTAADAAPSAPGGGQGSHGRPMVPRARPVGVIRLL